MRPQERPPARRQPCLSRQNRATQYKQPRCDRDRCSVRRRVKPWQSTFHRGTELRDRQKQSPVRGNRSVPGQSSIPPSYVLANGVPQSHDIRINRGRSQSEQPKKLSKLHNVCFSCKDDWRVAGHASDVTGGFVSCKLELYGRCYL